jgi:hypothetical protein
MNRRATKGNTLRIVWGWIWPARSVQSVEDLVGCGGEAAGGGSWRRSREGRKNEEGVVGLGRARAPHIKWMCGALPSGAAVSPCGAAPIGATHPATSDRCTAQHRGRHVGWESGAASTGATQ